MAEDNEGRLVTINENKGGRVREKNDGTRCVKMDFVFIAWFSCNLAYLTSIRRKVLRHKPTSNRRYKLEVEISQGWGV